MTQHEHDHVHEPHTHEPPSREVVVTGGDGGVIVGVIVALALVLFVVWMFAFRDTGGEGVLPSEVDVTIETEQEGG